MVGWGGHSDRASSLDGCWSTCDTRPARQLAKVARAHFALEVDLPRPGQSMELVVVRKRLGSWNPLLGHVCPTASWAGIVLMVVVQNRTLKIARKEHGLIF